MGNKSGASGSIKKKGPGISKLLKPYRGMIFLLIFFALLSNGVNLILPRIIASGIDAFPSHYVLQPLLIKFLSAAIIIFIFTFFQSIIQTNTSERVARDLRAQLAARISTQSYAYIEKANPSKLLTNLTADVDSVKLFISQAIVTIASSLIIIIGACIMLFSIICSTRATTRSFSAGWNTWTSLPLSSILYWRASFFLSAACGLTS